VRYSALCEVMCAGTNGGAVGDMSANGGRKKHDVGDNMSGNGGAAVVSGTNGGATIQPPTQALVSVFTHRSRLGQ